MPSEALSDVKICQRACVRAGTNRITSLTDNLAEAILLNDNYDSVVDEALASYHWHFATVQVDLSRLSDTPPAPWQGLYQVPSASLAIRRLWVNSYEVVNWAMFDGGKLAVDAGVDDTVSLEHTYRCDEAQFHPVFVEFIVYRLAELLAVGIAHSPSRAEYFAARASQYERRARFQDSKERTGSKIRAKRLVTYR